MGNTTTECEDGMLPKEKADSLSLDEGGEEAVLKKGPWTSAEDAILVEYVKKHGEGNWNAVQKHSGLSRCGKSCRLRWANHLRPNLKKGSFTPDEERLIVELHAKMGNKWARMAAHLPGRTDNEIKNYWNTRIKRRQRAGLPLYPPELCSQDSHDNQQIRNINNFNRGDTHHIMQANHLDIPEIKFNNLNSKQGVLSYASRLPDISIGNMLNQALGSSQCYGFVPATMHPPKRLRGSETLFPGFNNKFTNGFQPLEFQNDTIRKTNQHFGLSFPYDPDPNGKLLSTFGMMHGSHAVSNVNLCTSMPLLGSLKMELPSFQYPETVLGDWGASPSLLPSLESVDTFIQSPQSPARLTESDCVSLQNSGLLEALVYKPETLSCAKNQSSEKSSNSCVVTPGDMADSSMLNNHGTDWEGYVDPISPLGRPAASIFSECTPLSESPVDEQNVPKPQSGSEIKLEPMEFFTTDEERQTPAQLSFPRPDALLEGGWYDQSSEYATSAFVGEDICIDSQQLAAESASSNQGWNAQIYSWNNLPPVDQISDIL